MSPRRRAVSPVRRRSAGSVSVQAEDRTGNIRVPAASSELGSLAYQLGDLGKLPNLYLTARV